MCVYKVKVNVVKGLKKLSNAGDAARVKKPFHVAVMLTADYYVWTSERREIALLKRTQQFVCLSHSLKFSLHLSLASLRCGCDEAKRVTNLCV